MEGDDELSIERLADLLCCLGVLLMGRKDLREGVIGAVPVVGVEERAGD